MSEEVEIEKKASQCSNSTSRYSSRSSKVSFRASTSSQASNESEVMPRLSSTSSLEMRGTTRPRRSTQAVRRALFGPITKKSTMSACARPDLHPTRRKVHEVIENVVFKAAMALIVIFNIWLVAFDTDLRAVNEPVPIWVEWCEHGCLLAYVGDLGARIFVDRAAALYCTSNWFDFVIVASDVVFEVLDRIIGDLPSLSILRIVRVLRAVRIMRDFMMFRELYLMMRGLLSALRAIMFATILIAVVLTMWSIMAVELMHKLNQQLDDEGAYIGCKRCRNAFESVGASNLTFLKGIIAGDSWGEVSIPLMEAHPWTAVIILSAFLSVQLGLLNVIVAVIVDRQSSARADDEELVYTIKQEQLLKSYDRLMQVFKSIDLDGNGSLTLPELQSSYETCEEFKDMLDLLDIGDEDLTLVFSILDKNRDGQIGFEEFVQQLHALRSRDSHTLLIFIKHYAAEIWSALENKHGRLLEQAVRQNERIMQCQTQISALKSSGASEQTTCRDRKSSGALEQTTCRDRGRDLAEKHPRARKGFHDAQGDMEHQGGCSQPSKQLPPSNEQADRWLSRAPGYPDVHDATLRSELEWLHRRLAHQLGAALSETAHRLSALSTGTSVALDAMAPSKWEPMSEVIPSERIPTGTWDIILESKAHHCLPDESVVLDESEGCGVPEASYSAAAPSVTANANSWYHAPQAVMVQAAHGSGGTGFGPMASGIPQVLAAPVGSNEAEPALMAALSSACASAAQGPPTPQGRMVLRM